MAQKNKAKTKVSSTKAVAKASKKVVKVVASKTERMASTKLKPKAATPVAPPSNASKSKASKPVAVKAKLAPAKTVAVSAKQKPKSAAIVAKPGKSSKVADKSAAMVPKVAKAAPVAAANSKPAHPHKAPQPAKAVVSAKAQQRPEVSSARQHVAARAVSPAVEARAVPAAVAKKADQRISAPVVPAGAASTPATPRAIAERTAATRQMMAANKKPVSQRHGFRANEFIVYPAHGVGRIVGIEEQEIAGMSLELFVINFEKEKLTLRVPTGKLQSIGMRKLSDDGVVRRAIDTLKGRARIKRTMWSRRAQEYVAKINSGDLVAIAEVVRDLYRSEAQPEQSYSERQLYEKALDRMAHEIAAVEKLDERGAVQRIQDVLSKSARGRRMAEEGDDDVVGKVAEIAEIKAA